jgi:hypothetical protein
LTPSSGATMPPPGTAAAPTSPATEHDAEVA